MDSTEEQLEYVNKLLGERNVCPNKNIRKKLKKYFKELEKKNMNTKVEKFLDLIAEGKSFDFATNEAGIGGMGIYETLVMIANAWKSIKELNTSLVELTKVTDVTVEELEK